MRVVSLRSRSVPFAVAAVVLSTLLAGCVSDDPPATIWPPKGFEFVAEEVVQVGNRLDTVRKFRLTGDGLAVYGTSTRPLTTTDGDRELSLPVFDRLDVYRLVPSAVRAFARRLHRHGFFALPEFPTNAPAAGAPTGMVLLRVRSVDGEHQVALHGRVRGTLAELVRVVEAHLPEQERFGGVEGDSRTVVRVLRGVPPPRQDLAGALGAHFLLLDERGEDPAVLADAFALACRSGSRSLAEDLLTRWQRAVGPAARPVFADEPAVGDPVELRRRFLPAP
ncbi:MAG: hypothetical protein U1F60_11590 [Planctomycetota bacterium]